MKSPALPRRTTLARAIGLGCAAPVLFLASAHAAIQCESLAAVSLPDTTITAAQSVPAGSYTPPGSAALPNVPAFCRVTGTTAPSIKFEVWLPQAQWNGKFQGVGNGGTAGV